MKLFHVIFQSESVKSFIVVEKDDENNSLKREWRGSDVRIIRKDSRQCKVV